MATEAQIKTFIAQIAPLIQKYAKAKGYKVCSPIIAQACLESAYGTSSLGYKYHNYFGMKCGSSWKGKSVNLTTGEEYTVGQYTTIKANFRVYDSMEAGVAGYFDFISTSRYANLKSATTAADYLNKIKADGYATSSSYVTNNLTVVNKYKLTQYDNFNASTNSASSAATTSKYYPKYTGTSGKIDEVFAAIGVPATMRGNASRRKKIATANKISNYIGSTAQNLTLISLAKKGMLVKP